MSATRAFFAGLVVAGCGAQTPAAPGPRTPREVGERVLAALVAKDWARLRALYWSGEAARAACGVSGERAAALEASIEEDTRRAEEDFGRCAELAWVGARLVDVRGGDEEGRVDACAGEVFRLGDIRLTIEVGGDAREVVLDHPTLADGVIVLVDDLRCRAADPVCGRYFDHMLGLVAGAAVVSDGDRTKFTAGERAKGEFDRACQLLVARRAHIGEVLRCALAATTYEAAKACESGPPSAPDSTP